jgi:hypothetical protein
LLQHVRRSANRFELKYIVSHDRVAPFVDALSPYLVDDRNVAGERGYPVYSVYWDSEDWTLFWEKIEGLKNRRKLRVRRYADGKHGFIEIKHRMDRTLQKRRSRLPLTTIYETFRGEEDVAWRPEAEGDDGQGTDPVVAEATYLRERYRLRPRMAVSYQRRAFFGKYDPDLRITFDTRLQYDPHALDIAEPFETGRYIVDPRVVIMEVKFSERAPVWLCNLLSSFDFKMTRLSKYCSAVDLAYFGNRLT